MKFDFAYKDGKIVKISEVERGDKCGCLCPSCNAPLTARMGEERVHHFAHSKSKECKNYGETMLHLMAKKIFLEDTHICVPFFNIIKGNYSDNEFITYENVEIENLYEDIKPDIILKIKDKIIFVEIAVTHKIDKEKLEKIKKHKISTLEIDLGSHYRKQTTFDYDKLKEIILYQNNDIKRWVYNKKDKKNYKEHFDYKKKFNEEFEIKEKNKAKFYKSKGLVGALWNDPKDDFEKYYGRFFLNNMHYHIYLRTQTKKTENSPTYEINLYKTYSKYSPDLDISYMYDTGLLWEWENGDMSGFINYWNGKYKEKIQLKIIKYNKIKEEHPDFLIKLNHYKSKGDT